MTLNFLNNVKSNEIGIFGSSNAKMFSLMKNLNIFAYPGKTSKGISKKMRHMTI